MATPEEMTAKMVAHLPEKTGKSLAEWLRITSAAGLTKHGEIVKLLKSAHGMTHGFANLVAHETLRAARPEEEEDLVGAQYQGAKAGLRPIYAALVAAVSRFGSDVEIAPKKSYVALRRSKQFGLIKAATRERIDVGLNLKGEPTTGRLLPSGSLGAMVSHRVSITSTDEIDAELKAWLKKAYQSA